MALFRRNKTDDTTALPEEVTNYYQAEHRERTWMAWLLALVTLGVTAVIIIGLFFGGRWAYRKLRHNTDTTTSVVTQKPAESPKSTAPATNSTPNSGTATPSPSKGSVNAPTNPSSPTPSSTTTPPTTSTTTPSTAATTNTSLPNTGPGDTLAIFVTVSVLAYFAHRKLSSQQ